MPVSPQKRIKKRAGTKNPCSPFAIQLNSGVNFFEGNPGKTFWIGLALSTGAAGLAAAWNGVLAPLLKPKEET